MDETEEKSKEPAVEPPPTEAIEVIKLRPGEIINVFELADSFDDEQISNALAEHGKDSMERFVYMFEDKDGKRVIGLSKNGVDEIVQHMERQGIALREIGDAQVIDSGEHINVLIKAGRYYIDGKGNEQLGATAIGSKRQWKKLKTKKSGVIDNPFYLEQAISKAARNAKRRLMPEALIKKLIAERMGLNKIRTIKVEGKIDDNGNVIAESAADVKPEAVEKNNLFKRIVDKGLTEALNAALKGRTREQLSIAELEAILGKNTETKPAATEHPLEIFYRDIKAAKKLIVSFPDFYGAMKILFKEVDLEKPTLEQIGSMRRSVEGMTKEQIEGIK